MKNLLILFITLSFFSCKEEKLMFAAVCDVTVIKYKDGVLYSAEQKKQQHYSEYTAHQLSEIYTGNNIIKNNEAEWQVISNATCKPF